MTVYILVSFGIFFCLQFFCTQIIYSKNYFLVAMIATLLLPFTFLLFFKQGEVILILNAGFLSMYYLLILLGIKRGYKKINKKLINKNFIDDKYDDKDFTYVLWDGDLPTAGNWWNKKLASEPSWLDHLFTYALLIVPIVFFWFVNSFWS